MMMIRKSNERGHANHGWLDSYHTFSFADYHDPKWLGFRTLRVINDDLIQPGMGFGTHPHRDMEIISFVLQGSLAHRDSMGNGRVIRAGEFQYMSAGTGVQHSEFNPSETETTRLLQIWIRPDTQGVKPRYAEKGTAAAPAGQLNLIASKDGRAASIAIHQDAELWHARLAAGQTVVHPLAPNRHAWLHVAEGEVTVNGQSLSGGDAIGVSAEAVLSVTAVTAAQVLLFDLN